MFMFLGKDMVSEMNIPGTLEILTSCRQWSIEVGMDAYLYNTAGVMNLVP